MRFDLGKIGPGMVQARCVRSCRLTLRFESARSDDLIGLGVEARRLGAAAMQVMRRSKRRQELNAASQQNLPATGAPARARRPSARGSRVSSFDSSLNPLEAGHVGEWGASYGDGAISPRPAVNAGALMWRRRLSRTEDAYLHRTRRFYEYHPRRDARRPRAEEVTAFLNHLALVHRVAALTRDQALAALLSLYRHGLEVDLPWLDGFVRAHRLPIVLTRNEVRVVRSRLGGTAWDGDVALPLRSEPVDCCLRRVKRPGSRAARPRIVHPVET